MLQAGTIYIRFLIYLKAIYEKLLPQNYSATTITRATGLEKVDQLDDRKITIHSEKVSYQS